MARAITPTPKLGAKASEKFLKKVRRGLRKPVGLVPTPKLSEAQRKIRRYAHNREK